MHVKFKESNAFAKNVIEIDSLGEDMEKISLKDSPIQEDKQEPNGEVQKWNHHNHFLKIGDMLQIIPKISS